MVPLVMNSIEKLNKIGINAEVIDLRSSYPLDEELIASSLSRTGRVVIADIDWVFCGIGSEISAIITENYFNLLKAPIKRIGLPHTSHPVSYSLEDVFYPNEETIVNTVKEVYYYK